MSGDTTELTTEEEFYRRLDTLIGEAVENDLTIEGGWACRSMDGQYEYEALISAVDRSNS
ncbi:hypothetical protein [Halomarina oriensis]|uniref:Uncharacterized protein n=1 Tax=Halomarina oriensis TaxID=671145 RepID=A0A6B0GNB4_9EURY|nr:hypothetical protein [Halomarina oriensis]MWG33068.1 hypothetical protein [Halomarina oriensis]